MRLDLMHCSLLHKPLKLHEILCVCPFVGLSIRLLGPCLWVCEVIAVFGLAVGVVGVVFCGMVWWVCFGVASVVCGVWCVWCVL